MPVPNPSGPIFDIYGGSITTGKTTSWSSTQRGRSGDRASS